MASCGAFKPDLKQSKDVVYKYINSYNDCLLDNIAIVNKDMSKLINQHETDNTLLNSSIEINNDSMNMYLIDYYYVITKGIVYLLSLTIFIYFFGINNLIEAIKVTGTVIKDKAVVIKDKAVEIKDKVLEPKL